MQSNPSSTASCRLNGQHQLRSARYRADRTRPILRKQPEPVSPRKATRIRHLRSENVTVGPTLPVRSWGQRKHPTVSSMRQRPRVPWAQSACNWKNCGRTWILAVCNIITHKNTCTCWASAYFCMKTWLVHGRFVLYQMVQIKSTISQIYLLKLFTRQQDLFQRWNENTRKSGNHILQENASHSMKQVIFNNCAPGLSQYIIQWYRKNPSRIQVQAVLEIFWGSLRKKYGLLQKSNLIALKTSVIQFRIHFP